MIDKLSKLDQEIFLWFNSHHTPFMDNVMVFISGKLEWIPLYALLLFFVYRKYNKATLWVLIGAALVVTLADQSSVHLFKNVVQRYRPCHNLDIGHLVHIVNGKCGGRYGFVSSHAANTFGIATFLGFLLKYKFKSYPLTLLLLWAALVSYSRVYLGVHYTGDIFVGALLGVLIGYLVYRLVASMIQQYPLK